MIFRRPFADVIDRQLVLFAQEHGRLLEEMEEAERVYDRADRDEAEERYADYLDLVETAGEALASLRDFFAATLDEDAAETYRAAFNRAAVKRWPRLAIELD